MGRVGVRQGMAMEIATGAMITEIHGHKTPQKVYVGNRALCFNPGAKAAAATGLPPCPIGGLEGRFHLGNLSIFPLLVAIH